MTTGKTKSVQGESPGNMATNLREMLQRHIDAESVASALKGEFAGMRDINQMAETRLRAVVATKQEWQSVPIQKLDEEIDKIIEAEKGHIAWKEVASNHAKKLEYLASIYQNELQDVKTSKEYKDKLAEEIAVITSNESPQNPKELGVEQWARLKAWNSSQAKIEKEFGSRAPEAWRHEAPQMVHEHNILRSPQDSLH